MTRLRAVPTWGLLTALVALSTALRFWAGTRVLTPWITPDEVLYGEFAKSLYRDGRFELLGRPAEFLSLVYPALVGPLLALDDLERWYHWTKLLQALVMSLAAVPAYLWAHALASRGWALAAAALTLAIPGLAYSGLLMTEVAFYPLTLTAAWAAARALEAPTLARQALVVGAVAAAALTRLQAFALVAVLLTALGVDGALGGSVRRLRRLLPSLAGLAALCVAWAGWRLRNGGPPSRVFGGYEPAGQAHYDLGAAARFVAYHLADVVLFSGVAPAVALVLLFAARPRPPALRAYLAVAVSLVAWFSLEVGIFASSHVGLLAERNLLPLAPVLFVGLAAWLARGGPRPRTLTAGGVAGALLVVAYLPLERLVSPEAFPDAFTLLPLIELERGRPGLDLDLAVTAGFALCLVTLALLPRRTLALVPAVLAAAFVVVSAWSSREIADRASFLQKLSTGPDRRWIDRRADGPTAFLFIGEFNWPAPWENLFWNRRVERVYALLTARVPGGLPQEPVGPLEDGRLVLANGRPARAEYVAAAYPVAFAGRPVATAGDGIVLWRLDQPVRLSVWTQRVPGHIRVLVYACRPGRLDLVLLPAVDDVVELRRNERLYRRVRLPGRKRWRTSVPARPRAPLGERLCTFDVVSGSGLIAPTVRFVRR